MEVVGSRQFEELTLSPHQPDTFQLTLGVGIKGEKGSELFNLEVCNPLWLDKLCREGAFVIGAWRIFTREFDPPVFVERLKASIARCSGSTPKEALGQVSCIAMSEFVDYQGGVRPTFL